MGDSIENDANAAEADHWESIHSAWVHWWNIMREVISEPSKLRSPWNDAYERLEALSGRLPAEAGPGTVAPGDSQGEPARMERFPGGEFRLNTGYGSYLHAIGTPCGLLLQAGCNGRFTVSFELERHQVSVLAKLAGLR